MARYLKRYIEKDIEEILKTSGVVVVAGPKFCGKTTTAKNFFFAVNYIEPSAIAVHGFTPEKLAILSDGKTFSSEADEIYDDFLSADLIVAHNVKFDIGFLIAEFNILNLCLRITIQQKSNYNKTNKDYNRNK